MSNLERDPISRRNLFRLGAGAAGLLIADRIIGTGLTSDGTAAGAKSDESGTNTKNKGKKPTPEVVIQKPEPIKVPSTTVAQDRLDMLFANINYAFQTGDPSYLDYSLGSIDKTEEGADTPFGESIAVGVAAMKRARKNGDKKRTTTMTPTVLMEDNSDPTVDKVLLSYGTRDKGRYIDEDMGIGYGVALMRYDEEIGGQRMIYFGNFNAADKDKFLSNPKLLTLYTTQFAQEHS